MAGLEAVPFQNVILLEFSRKGRKGEPSHNTIAAPFLSRMRSSARPPAEPAYWFALSGLGPGMLALAMGGTCEVSATGS